MQAMRKNMRCFEQFVEFVSDRRLYIVLRGRWCDICLNKHAWNDDRSDDSSARFNEDLEHVPRGYYVGVFIVEIGRDVVLKQRVGNECVQPVYRTVAPCPQVSSGQPDIVKGMASPCGECIGLE
jgi:hypothetical protein